MKKVLAISGGVDSMVLLDLACRSGKYSRDKLIVAHFDHGIRQNSGIDAEFVQRKAQEYGVECRVGKGELGAGASEAKARAARYDFLHQVANNNGQIAEVWTAHHLDDLVESVAINFMRGTGWRGLAVFGATNVRRPFLETEMIYEPMDRAAIFEYAAKRGLEYREDPSNSWDEYLRNRIRHQMHIHESDTTLDFSEKMQIYQLWRAQQTLCEGIDKSVASLVPNPSGTWQREWFRSLTPEVALELLRAGTLRAGIAATRPQLEDFRQAILEYVPGKYFNLPRDRLVRINKATFTI